MLAYFLLFELKMISSNSNGNSEMSFGVVQLEIKTWIKLAQMSNLAVTRGYTFDTTLS